MATAGRNHINAKTQFFSENCTFLARSREGRRITLTIEKGGKKKTGNTAKGASQTPWQRNLLLEKNHSAKCILYRVPRGSF